MLMNFETSVSPHIRVRDDAQRIMWWVVFALLFPVAAATWFFGFKALVLVVFTTIVALLDYHTGRVIYDVRDDLPHSQLSPEPTPSPSSVP